MRSLRSASFTGFNPHGPSLPGLTRQCIFLEKAVLHPGQACFEVTRRSVKKGDKDHVPQHPDAVQFRAAGDGGGNPRLRAAIRAQALRFQQTVADKRRCVRPRRRGGVRCGSPSARHAAYERACAGS